MYYQTCCEGNDVGMVHNKWIQEFTSAWCFIMSRPDCLSVVNKSLHGQAVVLTTVMLVHPACCVVNTVTNTCSSNNYTSMFTKLMMLIQKLFMAYQHFHQHLK